MSEEKDFDLAICKVPRKDKHGNDITSDKIGRGGRHRKEGTYSGTVYDIELIDETTSSLPIKSTEEDYSLCYEDLPWYAQLIIDVIPTIVDGLTEIAKESFRNWLQNRQEKRHTALRKSKHTVSIATKKKVVKFDSKSQVVEEIGTLNELDTTNCSHIYKNVYPWNFISKEVLESGSCQCY